MQKDVRHPPSKLFVVAVVAVIIVAVVMLKRNAIHVGPTVSPAVAAAPLPAPDDAEKTKAPASKSAFDSIKVQAIIYNAKHPVTLINGKALDIGERINGVEVISIEPSKVVLACNGEQKTFNLK